MKTHTHDLETDNEDNSEVNEHENDYGLDVHDIKKTSKLDFL